MKTKTKKPRRTGGATDISKILFSLAKDANGLAGDYSREQTNLALHYQIENGATDEAEDALIRLAKRLRDAGRLSADCFLCILGNGAEYLSLKIADADPQLKAITAEMDAIEKAEGLKENESWYAGEGPEAWEALSAQYDKRYQEIEADVMRSYGEKEIAALYLNNYEEFKRQHEAGRRVLHNDPGGKKLEELKKQARAGG